MVSNEILYASFEPSEATLLSECSSANILAEYPQLCSALARIFPHLLLIDNILEIVTWSNEDPYQNFLFIVLYSIIVVYWSFFGSVALPLIFAISFSSAVWSVNSIIYDSEFDEKPTLDEVLHTLHNITIMFEMLLRPIQQFNFRRRHFITALCMCGLLTPIHAFFVKRLLSPRLYTLAGGIIILTYHSPWSYAIRRLLWRSVYLRVLFYYITGLDVKLDRNVSKPKHLESILHSPKSSGDENEDDRYLAITKSKDFKILKKIAIAPDGFQFIIRFDVLENERRWIGLGWCKYMINNERPLYCYQNSMNEAPSNYESTNIFPDTNDEIFRYDWKWIDQKWGIDYHYSDETSKTGWVYYDNNWLNQSSEDGFSKFCRSRNWTRKALLTVIKRTATKV